MSADAEGVTAAIEAWHRRRQNDPAMVRLRAVLEWLTGQGGEAARTAVELDAAVGLIESSAWMEGRRQAQHAYRAGDGAVRLRLWPVTVDGDQTNILVADGMARPGVAANSGVAQARRDEVHEQARRCSATAGALTFEGLACIPDLDAAAPQGVAVVAAEHPGAVFEPFIRAEAGSTVVSPEIGPYLEAVIVAAREHVAQWESGARTPDTALALDTAVRELDGRFPHAAMTFGRTDRSADGSGDHG